jgi:hypothetical protein
MSICILASYYMRNASFSHGEACVNNGVYFWRHDTTEAPSEIADSRAQLWIRTQDARTGQYGSVVSQGAYRGNHSGRPKPVLLLEGKCAGPPSSLADVSFTGLSNDLCSALDCIWYKVFWESACCARGHRYILISDHLVCTHHSICKHAQDRRQDVYTVCRDPSAFGIGLGASDMCITKRCVSVFLKTGSIMQQSIRRNICRRCVQHAGHTKSSGHLSGQGVTKPVCWMTSQPLLEALRRDARGANNIPAMLNTS